MNILTTVFFSDNPNILYPHDVVRFLQTPNLQDSHVGESKDMFDIDMRQSLKTLEEDVSGSDDDIPLLSLKRK